jgi:hypothetical protein
MAMARMLFPWEHPYDRDPPLKRGDWFTVSEEMLQKAGVDGENYLMFLNEAADKKGHLRNYTFRIGGGSNWVNFDFSKAAIHEMIHTGVLKICSEDQTAKLILLYGTFDEHGDEANRSR